MKKIKTLIIGIIFFAFVLLITSCSSKGNNEIQGTYYLYEKETYNKEVYIILEKNTWKDDDDTKGDYKISGETITFYVELFGSKEELYSGIIKDGVMKITILGKVSYYCKKGKTPFQNSSNQTHTYPELFNKWDETHHWKECECGEKSEEAEHTYGAWKITKEATIDSEGTKERECSVCHYKELEIIPKHKHRYPSTYNKCNETHHWKECECGEKSEEAKHTYGTWITTKAPTEDFEGTKERECSVCHYKELGSLPKHKHSYPSSFNKCNETHHWKECECGEKSEEAKHTYGTWITTKAPTVDTEGTKERECSICKYKKTEILPKKEETQGLTFEFNKNQNSYSVLGIGKATDTDIVIPSSYNNYPVTSIAERAFYNCSNLTSITIPSSVTSIGRYAFENCSSLTSIVMPNSVTSIGGNAFYNCYKLVEVYNLSNLNITAGSYENGYVGYYAKVIHTTLEEPSRLIEKDNYVFYKDENNQYYLVSYKGTETELVLPKDIEGDAYKINDYAFYNCNNLTSIIIPEGVISIGKYTFEGCKHLINVYYEGSLADWCNIKFASLSANPMRLANHFYLRNSCNEWGEVTSIEIPDNITEIANNQFCGFNNLTSITISSSVTSIKDNAFSHCYRLVEIYNLSNLKITAGSIDNGYVGRNAQVIHTSLGEESRLIEKDDYVFYKDDNKKYYLVKYKGKEQKITLPKDIEGNAYKINDYAFYNCNNLTSIIIPEGVISIGNYAFNECSNLTNIEIPNSVTNIGFYAFSGCSNLKYNEYKNTMYLGNNTNLYLWLIKAKNQECTINENSKYIYHSAFNRCSNLTYIIIPEGVISIGNYAFSGCSSLTSVTIGNNVTSIGEGTFSECRSLTSIIIPNSVTSIGERAFFNCVNLEYNCYSDGEYLGNSSNPYLWLMRKSYTYNNCQINEKTKFINSNAFLNSRYTSIKIPDSVESIEAFAFQNCKDLAAIVIGNSVTNIEEKAFSGCSNLKEVYYKGTSIEWNNISIDPLNSVLTSATRYYYSETKPTIPGNYWHYVSGIMIKW